MTREIAFVPIVDSRKKDMARKAPLSPRELDVIRLVGRDKEGRGRREGHKARAGSSKMKASPDKLRDPLGELVRDVKERSVYLLDRETFIASIFERIKQEEKFLPIAVTGGRQARDTTSGALFALTRRTTSRYIQTRTTLNWISTGDNSTAKKLGYVTMFWNDMATNYPADYEERYRPFGFQCGTETVFCNQSGEVIGVFAGLKSAETAFSDAEMPAIRLMSPYIFYGFQRYRAPPVETDFFTVMCFDEFPFGIVTSDSDGRITYLNETAKRLITTIDHSIPAKLPMPLMKRMRLLKEIPKIMRRAIPDVSGNRGIRAPIRDVSVCYRFDENHGGRYLPVKGSGWVFFIDSRRKDGDTKSRSRRARSRLSG